MNRECAFRLGPVLALVAIVAGVNAVSLPAQGATGTSALSVWTAASAPAATGGWYAADYADGEWVALGDGNEVATSVDGLTWSVGPVPSGSWHSVAYGNRKFVALSSTDAGTEEIMSTNGTSWTPVPGPVGQWTAITFGAGLFVAVSSQGQIDISSDGVHWTQAWRHSNYDLTSIAFGRGHFVAGDVGLGALIISATGSRWSRYLLPMTGLQWSGVAYGNGNFIALGGPGTTYIATSVFGFVWSLHSDPLVGNIRAATFGCGDFVAIGPTTGTTASFLSSPTGINWSTTTVSTSTTSSWTAVAYGAHRFVAVDNSGDIVSSNSAPDCAAAIPTAPLQVSGNIRSGEVWTYMHPSSSPGGAPVTSYRVTITDGSTTRTCNAPVYYQPNCIVRGLKNHRVYWITAQARNRFGFSVATDPEFAIPVESRSFSAVPSTSVVSYSSPLVVQVTGVAANSQGIYPTSTITVHVGARVFACRSNPFGECLITVENPALGRSKIYATYVGYGRSYQSPTTSVTVRE